MGTLPREIAKISFSVTLVRIIKCCRKYEISTTAKCASQRTVKTVHHLGVLYNLMGSNPSNSKVHHEEQEQALSLEHSLFRISRKIFPPIFLTFFISKWEVNLECMV